MPRHLSADAFSRSVPINPRMLHVIAVISNPVQWQTRLQLARDFLARMRAAGVHITLVEHAFGERPFELDEEEVDTYVPVRGGDDSELWLKESLINIGVQKLPRDWKYMAWIDADVGFANHNWAVDTIHALQHWPVVQCWTKCVDLGPSHEIIPDEAGRLEQRSFGAAWMAGDFEQYDWAQPEKAHNWHPYFQGHVGYAWAIRREAYDGLGGLISWVPTGAADWQMAMAFAQRLQPHPERSEGFNHKLMIFQERADRHIQQSIGAVDGMLLHYYHGPKRKRGYVSRDVMLRSTGFDPDRDLVFDLQGIPVLTGVNRKLRDFLRRYFRSRLEDGFDVQDVSTSTSPKRLFENMAPPPGMFGGTEQSR